ncbi:hypothetical protein PIROE2DRAFT_6874 [Piromyces sp. E2]|nr:hypothetical protein PIROE2DRAFT_6874 [Piromyces sp. E2]|eukprot:OUM65982.1 hypothetical protein PIROE2DRAFT_6874 [Piromyces sp. E2]
MTNNKQKDFQLLKMMRIPFILNNILYSGIFVICIVMDIITLKSYIDFEQISILSNNYTLFIPLTIITFILLAFQVYIGFATNKYLNKKINNRNASNPYLNIDELMECKSDSLSTSEAVSSHTTKIQNKEKNSTKEDNVTNKERQSISIIVNKPSTISNPDIQIKKEKNNNTLPSPNSDVTINNNSLIPCIPLNSNSS